MNKNMYVKKVFAILFIIILTISTVACSAGTKEASNQSITGNNTNKTVGAIDKNNKDSFNVTLVGGVVGGFWSGMGTAISQVFAKSYPGSAATYEPGSGAGNIKLLDEKQVEVGLVQSVEVIAAQKGIEPFTKKFENLHALAAVYDNAVLQIAVSKSFADKYGVHNFDDVIAKKAPIRIGINQKGNLNSTASLAVLESYGLTEDVLKKWGGAVSYLGGSPAQRLEAIQTGRTDVSMGYTFAPDKDILEAAVKTKFELWSINENALNKLKADWDLNRKVITKGTYEWQKEDVTTASMGALILVGTKAKDQDVYKMAKALKENIDILKNVHPALKDLSPQRLADTGAIPLAPAAKEYYKEIGAIK